MFRHRRLRGLPIEGHSTRPPVPQPRRRALLVESECCRIVENHLHWRGRHLCRPEGRPGPRSEPPARPPTGAPARAGPRFVRVPQRTEERRLPDARLSLDHERPGRRGTGVDERRHGRQLGFAADDDRTLSYRGSHHSKSSPVSRHESQPSETTATSPIHAPSPPHGKVGVTWRVERCPRPLMTRRTSNGTACPKGHPGFRPHPRRVGTRSEPWASPTTTAEPRHDRTARRAIHSRRGERG
jgi:hypothetical protein